MTETDGAMPRRRRAIGELGDAMRALIEYATTTEVPAEEILRAAEQLRAAGGLLAARVRGRGELPSADDLLGGVRLYNPVIGSGSALAPPLRVAIEDGVAVGHCTLGMAYEGPPTYAHGGVIAMLLDQILGHAVVASGSPGMTVRLDTSYRKPVPLLTPLRLTAEVLAVDGRVVTATGAVTTAQAPGEILSEATGRFVALRAEQARELFGPVLGQR